MPRYVVAPGRGALSIPPDWQHRLEQIPGVGWIGSTETRVQIEAESEAVDEIRRVLGEAFRIEAIEIRRASDSGSRGP